MIFDKDQVDSARRIESELNTMCNKLYSTDDCVSYSILHMKQLFGIASFLYN